MPLAPVPIAMGTTIDSLANSNYRLNALDAEKEQQRKRNELAYAQLALEERRRAADDAYRQMAFNRLSAAQQSDASFRDKAFERPYTSMTQAEINANMLARQAQDDARAYNMGRISSAERIAMEPYNRSTVYESDLIKGAKDDRAADRRLKAIELFIKARTAGALTPDQASLIQEANKRHDEVAKMANDEFTRRAKEYDGWFTSKDTARKQAWKEVSQIFGNRTMPDEATMTFGAKTEPVPTGAGYGNMQDIFGTINKLISGDDTPFVGPPAPAAGGGGGGGGAAAPPDTSGIPRIDPKTGRRVAGAGGRPNNLPAAAPPVAAPPVTYPDAADAVPDDGTGYQEPARPPWFNQVPAYFRENMTPSEILKMPAPSAAARGGYNFIDWPAIKRTQVTIGRSGKNPNARLEKVEEVPGRSWSPGRGGTTPPWQGWKPSWEQGSNNLLPGTGVQTQPGSRLEPTPGVSAQADADAQRRINALIGQGDEFGSTEPIY